MCRMNLSTWSWLGLSTGLVLLLVGCPAAQLSQAPAAFWQKRDLEELKAAFEARLTPYESAEITGFAFSREMIVREIKHNEVHMAEVLEGIAAAREAGLGPVKVNMVVKRGTNEQQILPMARHFRGSGIVLRFIEYMDVGATNGWRMEEVMPSSEVRALLASEFPLQALQASAPGETAERYAYADGAGEVGFISSVTHAFCGDCNRARLSTEGKLYLCLFAGNGYDLRALLRGGASDTDIASAIGHIWQGRSDRYSELRGTQPPDAGDGRRRVEMSYIGG